MSELDKLKWQCRRGTLELDIILEKYLEDGYAASSEQEKQAFQKFIELEDTELLAFLMGDKTADKAEFACLIEKMRITPESLLQHSRARKNIG